MATVFISYRRADSAGWAGRIHDHLRGQRGIDEVFIDAVSLQPGQDFEAAIDGVLERCDTVLVVIGPRWLDLRDVDGSRRLDDPDDLHRTEVERGLAKGLRVVPVLVDDATMPSRQELPEPLEPLARRHAFDVAPVGFARSMDGLVELLGGGAPPADGPPPGWQQPPAPPSRRSLPAWAVGGGIAALLLVAVVVAVLLLGGSDGDQEVSADGSTTSTSSTTTTTTTTTVPATTTAPPLPNEPEASAGPVLGGSTVCESGLEVNEVTSCPFARNVRDEYQASGGSSTITAFSPVTGESIQMSCAPGIPVVCTGGRDAAVYIR